MLGLLAAGQCSPTPHAEPTNVSFGSGLVVEPKRRGVDNDENCFSVDNRKYTFFTALLLLLVVGSSNPLA
jgi:hypothetical protein